MLSDQHTKNLMIVSGAIIATILGGYCFLASQAKAETAARHTGRVQADAPEEPKAYSWSGLYVGAHAGYGWGNATTTGDVADWGTDPKFIGPFPYDLKGAFGGATLGLNRQMGPIVVGVEVEAGYMGVEGDRKSESSTATYHQNHTVEGGLYALPAARIGFAVGNALVYGKGGYIWIDGEQKQETTKPGFITTASGRLEGWAYGGGLEYALGAGWSIKAEYLRLDLKDLEAAQTEKVTAPAVGHVFENHTKLDAIDTFKLGVNFKF